MDQAISEESHWLQQAKRFKLKKHAVLSGFYDRRKNCPDHDKCHMNDMTNGRRIHLIKMLLFV